MKCVWLFPQAQDLTQLSFSSSWLPAQCPVPRYTAGVCWWLWAASECLSVRVGFSSPVCVQPPSQPTHSCHCCPWGIQPEEFNYSFPPAGGSRVTQPSSSELSEFGVENSCSHSLCAFHCYSRVSWFTLWVKSWFLSGPIWVPFLQNNPRNVSLQSSQALLVFTVYMCCPLSPSTPQGRRKEEFCAVKTEQKP